MTSPSQPTSPSVDAETLADRIDQCAAIQLVGSDGIKGYLPVGSPKIISAALRALSAPRVEPVADDFAEFPYDDERFNKGVQHVVELFAKTLGIDDWEAGDGSENYDDDLQQTFLNIMEARNIYDPETGLIGFASAAPPSQPDTGVREALDYVRRVIIENAERAEDIVFDTASQEQNGGILGIKAVAEQAAVSLRAIADRLAALPPDAGSREGADLVRPAE